MRRLKVLVLMHEDLIPPETTEGLSEEQIDPWRMEYDVCKALAKLGHQVRRLGVANELAPIRQAIEEWKPHVAFNLLRHFHDITLYDAHLVSYLELLKTPYTGSNPRGLLLASDKGLCKKILTYHRIRVPAFAVFRQGKPLRRPKKLEFPLFVKSVADHASFGIAQASIVNDDKHLQERVQFMHESIGSDAIAEQYIEGRELTVGVLGNDRLKVFPVWELRFENLPEGTAPIATAQVKWNRKYQRKLGVRSTPATNLPNGKAKEIDRMARRCYRALNLSGFARLDLRLSAEGKVFLIDANPNPDLSDGEDFSASAKKAGIAYPQLVQKVLNLGLGYVPAWKGV